VRFVVLGGGCYGSFYTRQLIRAADAEAIPRPEIVVVDHNERPQVAELAADARVRIVRMDWEPFFDAYLGELEPNADDQIVPPPFTPHLALSWLLSALRRAHPHTIWNIEPFQVLPTTPFVHHTAIGTLTASHADWICPVHCIEPERCPETRGPRHWDMSDTARALAVSLSGAGQTISQVHLLQCLHFTHGVGTYPAAALLTAYREISGTEPGPGTDVRVLVGTVSRCHGAMHLLVGKSGTDTVSPAVIPNARTALNSPDSTNT